IAGENITIDKETNTISATGGSSESLWEVDPNSPNIIQPKEKRRLFSNLCFFVLQSTSSD
ncbi:hypothetical protein, partial [Spiroplasma endosymbiont of Danaus chrysippus]|uniref:hypothetical protein n=1 Tax=Spiroplasma endosymbiont of Danaus chrysippus TaxID=2691041 RepID=UPI00157A3363